MANCKHEARYYIDPEDTCCINFGGNLKCTYRCLKCNEYIVRPKPWEAWETLDEYRSQKVINRIEQTYERVE